MSFVPNHPAIPTHRFDPEPSRRLEPPVCRLLTITPFAITFVFGLLLISKRTRPFAVLMTQENYPVELLTFIFLIIAAFIGIHLTRRVRHLHAGGLAFTFYAVFTALLFLVGMEEIAWGQWFFHFQTPEPIKHLNTQGEFTIHNLQGMGGHTEYLRLAFGLCGLIGLTLSRSPRFQLIYVPRILWGWFVVIALFSAADLFCDYHALDTPVAKALDVMSEVIELLISIAAVLYLWLNTRRLRAN